MAQQITLNNIDISTLNVISGPKIALIDYPGDDTAASVTGGQTIFLSGSGFQTGAAVYVDNTIVSVVTVISSTLLSFSAPAKTAGEYGLYVVNPDGGTATFLSGIQYSGVPTWATNSGNLGTVYETQPVNAVLSASSDSAVSYALTSGALPVGVSLTGDTISGNTGAVSGNTTYNFVIDAVDAESQNTSRSFNIAVLADTVTWVTPDNNTTIVANSGESITQTLSATAASGAAVLYSANTLPSGITLSGNLISGSSGTVANTATLLTATSSLSSKTATRVVNFRIKEIVIPPGQVEYTTAGTYSWTAPAGVTAVSVVCVGGGGSGGTGTPGGGGGGLGWKNNVVVVPGQSYTVVVGAGGASAVNGGWGINGNSGTDSYFIDVTTVKGGGGNGGGINSGAGGTYTGDGGGNGGRGGVNISCNGSGGGGGAGGYAGNGGNGADYYCGSSTPLAGSGSGGGGGGGGVAYGDNNGNGNFPSGGAGGGGVGIMGQGASGGAGTNGTTIASITGGNGGSGGTAGGNGYPVTFLAGTSGGNGGGYGAGGGGATTAGSGGPYSRTSGAGGSGAVRIIWGTGRAFPSTNTGNL